MKTVVKIIPGHFMQVFEKDTGHIIGQIFIQRGQIQYMDPNQHKEIMPEKIYAADHLLFNGIEVLQFGRITDTGWVLNDSSSNPRRGNYLWERKIKYATNENPVAITRDLSAIFALDNPGYYNWHVENIDDNIVKLTTSKDSSD